MTTSPDPVKNPRAEIPRLEIGDPVPDMGWADVHGARVALGQSDHAGRTTVIYVCASPRAPAAERELAALRDLQAKFQALDAAVFVVTPDAPAENFALAARHDLPFLVLSDRGFVAGQAFGLAAPGDDPGNALPGDSMIVVDRNQRIAALVEPGAEATRAHAALAVSRGQAIEGPPRVVTMHAPVLIVPGVLSQAHCAHLIEHWETGQRYQGGVASGEYGRNVPLNRIKVREDVILPDLGPEAQALFAVFRRRLFPEIRKAYNFRVTRAETLRLGCYAADEGGHFRRHRDDVTPYTAHRRFAMSLNLNTGAYEGGYLRFPEYGHDFHSVGPGGAVVFSCSLLHEATKVTAGQRYVLLGFFYGETEQALRDRLAAQRRAATGPETP